MNEKNPTLCIVAGPNGSGKTSTTVQLLHNEWAENSLYINPDNIAVSYTHLKANYNDTYKNKTLAFCIGKHAAIVGVLQLHLLHVGRL